SLEPSWYERISGRRAEALVCVAYAFAARQLVTVPLDRREAELASSAALPSGIPPVAVQVDG
ncbi:MAG: hypothetical protein JWN59_1535, partial [Sphingomonas bacterium]|nr:hypothetical protein [Sphingomonas bacterium]